MSDADCTPGREPRSVAASMSVCLLVRSHISNTIHVHISRNFLYVLTAAVARSSDDHNAIVMYFRFGGLPADLSFVAAAEAMGDGANYNIPPIALFLYTKRAF